MLIHRQSIAVCATTMLLVAFREKAFPLLHHTAIRRFLENAD